MTSLLRVFLPVLAIVVMVVIVLTVLELRSTAPNSSHLKHGHESSLEIGSFFKDFKLTKLDQTSQLGQPTQKEILFSKIAPKLTLINLWASWCSACVSELPSLVDLREQYRTQGFDVFFVNIDKNPEKRALGLMQQFGLTRLSTFVDQHGKIPELFDIQVVPFTVILSKERKVLFTLSGEGAWQSVAFKKKIEGWLSE